MVESAKKTTLWVGDIELWMDSACVKSLFVRNELFIFQAQFALYITDCEVVPSEIQGRKGYALVNFECYDRANVALFTLNGSTVLGTNTVLNLRWATNPIENISKLVNALNDEDCE